MNKTYAIYFANLKVQRNFGNPSHFSYNREKDQKTQEDVPFYTMVLPREIRGLYSPCSRGPIQLVGCAEQGRLEKIRSCLSALLLFLLDCLLTSWSVIDSLATTFEGCCGKHRLFLSMQQPLPASWSQHFGSSLRTCPSLSMWSVGLGLQGRLVTGIWPIQRSCLLGPRDQFKAGQGWTDQSISGLLLKHLRKKFSVHWGCGEERKCT